MTSRLWSFVTVLITYLPWVVIATAAALAYFRNKSIPRMPLLIQVAGAGGAFLLGIGRWGIIQVMYMGGAPYNLSDATATIFTFLIFMAELVFAAGYAWEKLAASKRAAGFPVG